MQRHVGLQRLSSEHHSALVLARALAPETPPALRGGLPEAPDALLAAVRERWTLEIEPHFCVEERELLALSACGDAALQAHAAQIRAEHAALRQAFATFNTQNIHEQGAELSKRLQAHVRFEERDWFPALERALDEATLAQLVLRAKPEPEARSVGFHQDADGLWVAELDCGHRRHVRHAPPFQSAPWVLTETGRAERLGMPIPCSLCRMPRLPPCAVTYKHTPSYGADDVPAGLLRSHTLRAGTWGRIEVAEGRVTYVLEDEKDLAFVLNAGVDGIVAPERPHHIQLSADARFRLVFLKAQTQSNAG